MYILAIDTSSAWLSLAIFKEKNLVASVHKQSSMQHGKILLPEIQHLLQSQQILVEEIKGIVVGIGPGSYTGLRIGVTTAKIWGSMCEIPVYPVSSLKLMAMGAICIQKIIDTRTLVLSMIDARRLSCYVGGYIVNQQEQIQSVIADQHVDWKEWVDEMAEQFTAYDQILLVGKGIQEFEQYLKEKQLVTVTSITDDDVVFANTEYVNTEQLISFEPIDILEPYYAQKTLAEREWEIHHAQGESDESMVETTV